MATSQIDLHTHTTASDGSLTPAALVTQAVSLGIKVLGLTDHDTTDGLAEANVAAQGSGLRLVPGIELGTEIKGRALHLLGYGIEATDGSLQRALKEQQAMRLHRAQAIVSRLREQDYSITWERVQAIAGGAAIGRPHIAQALVEAGHATSVNDAFARLIGPGKPFYVARIGKLSPAQAITLIRRASGVAVLAHPVKVDLTRAVIDEFALDQLSSCIEAGLQGIEAYYTHYSPMLSERLLEVAKKHHLLVTGGSDFHGSAKPDYRLGEVYVPSAVIDRLSALLNTS